MEMEAISPSRESVPNYLKISSRRPVALSLIHIWKHPLEFKPRRKKTKVSKEEMKNLAELEKNEGASKLDDN